MERGGAAAAGNQSGYPGSENSEARLALATKCKVGDREKLQSFYSGRGGGEASECRLVCWLLLSYCVKYLCSRTGISNIVVELNETQMCATINKDKRKYLGFLKILLPCSLFLYINVNFISNSSLLTKKFLLTFYLKMPAKSYSQKTKKWCFTKPSVWKTFIPLLIIIKLKG